MKLTQKAETATTVLFIRLLSKLLAFDRTHKRALVMATDAMLCGVAAWVAFTLRLGTWHIWNFGMAVTALVALILWYPIAYYLGVYRAIFRFSGSGMIMGLVRACLLLTIPMMLIFLIIAIPGIPRTVGLLHPMTFLMLLTLSRLTARYLFTDVLPQRTYHGKQRNVMIYGAGAAGQQLALSMRHDPGMQLTGFIDDDKRLDGQRLDTQRVYHSSRIDTLLHDGLVTDILLAVPNISRHERNKILAKLEEYPVHVMTLPNMGEILDGTVSINDLQELHIEDLLGRDPVPPDPALMDKTILDRCVLVTGAGGSIGGELCRQIVQLKPTKLVIVEFAEYSLYAIEKELGKLVAGTAIELVPVLANVADEAICERVLERHAPQTIFHAAAYKHVPLVEANPIQGVLNNVRSTYNMAKSAQRFGCKNFILISTDKAVRPTNVMGASKRICELVLQGLAAERSDTVFAMVRFGNVLGSSGSVVPYFEKQIKEGGPVTLTHRDVTRYFMTIPEAAQLVIQAGAMAIGGEVYVLDMGESVKIYDLAVSMIRLSGLTVRDAAHPNGDIEIREVGLRPGEKLYEELLIGDNPTETEHERIMRAHEHMISWGKLDPMLADLFAVANDGKLKEVLGLVKILVPEYRSEASPAEDG